jgi:hypothetical protein
MLMVIGDRSDMSRRSFCRTSTRHQPENVPFHLNLDEFAAERFDV